MQFWRSFMALVPISLTFLGWLAAQSIHSQYSTILPVMIIGVGDPNVARYRRGDLLCSGACNMFSVVNVAVPCDPAQRILRNVMMLALVSSSQDRSRPLNPPAAYLR